MDGQADRQSDKRIYIYILYNCIYRQKERWMNTRVHEEDQQNVVVKHQHSNHVSLRHQHHKLNVS